MPPQAVYGAAAAAAAVAAAGVQGGAAAEGTQPTLADDIAWLRGLFSDDSDKDERLVLPQRQLQAAQPGLPPPVPPPLHSADSLFAQLAGQQGSRAAAPPAAAAPTLSEPSSLQAQLQSAVAQLWQEQQVQQQAAALSMAQQAGPPVPVAPLSLSAAGSEASVLLALCQPVTTAPPPHMPPGPQPAGWARGRTTVAAAPAATCAAPAGIAAAAPAVPHASKPAKRRRGERYSDAELAVLAREDPPRYRRILSTRKVPSNRRLWCGASRAACSAVPAAARGAAVLPAAPHVPADCTPIPAAPPPPPPCCCSRWQRTARACARRALPPPPPPPSLGRSQARPPWLNACASLVGGCCGFVCQWVDKAARCMRMTAAGEVGCPVPSACQPSLAQAEGRAPPLLPLSCCIAAEEENRRMREQLLRQRRGAAPAAGP